MEARLKHYLKMLLFSVLLLSQLLLNGCDSKNTIRVGTIQGPETQIMQVAADVAKRDYNLNVEIVPFTDYRLPNVALVKGDIDANMFQSIPYLSAQIEQYNYKIAPIGKVFIYPMGLYSTKIKSLRELPDKATVAVPNELSNETRALFLLQKAGLITLKPNAGFEATVKDIIANPRNLNIIALDAAQVASSLKQADIAAINTNYAIPAGFYPDQALFLEGADSPYVNVVVVQLKNTNNPQLLNLVQALHSPAVVAAANQIFGPGAAIPAWQQRSADQKP